MIKQSIKFIRESYSEFKRVQWPTKRETITLTAYVIGGSLLVGVLVTAMDFGFNELLGKIIG